MLILGIDPGSRVCGYGVISASAGTIGYVASGRIVLDAKSSLVARLADLHQELRQVIDRYQPDCASVEKVFFAKSVQSALSLGHARGVAVAVAAVGGLPVYEYSATEVKKTVVGYGRADKRQIQEMVTTLMALSSRPSEDSADALALAICHAYRRAAEESLKRAGAGRTP